MLLQDKSSVYFVIAFFSFQSATVDHRYFWKHCHRYNDWGPGTCTAWWVGLLQAHPHI